MYYQGSSEIQTDGLQTLYLMNPNYFGYSAATQQQTPANVLFLNSPTATTATVHTLDSDTALPQASLPQAQQFVGISLSHHQYPTRPLSHQAEIQTTHQNSISNFHYHSWGSVDHQSTNGNQPDMSLPQGLSLSLSPNQTPAFNKSSSRFLSDQDFVGKSSIGLMTSSKNCSSPSMSTTVSNGFNSMQHIIMGSKYRKAVQQVLYEVANVGNGINNDSSDQVRSKNKSKISQDSIISRRNFKTSGGGGDEGSKSGGPELTTAQRQEIEMKKAKLVTMLDEADQRYRQYHHRMEIIMASFEQAAGTGSAETYTQLAFRTISKQFRCLKNAISSQIKSLSESLNEEGNNLDEKFMPKFVDHHLRQQSPLHKLGIMQNNAWRSQRGLPERAVSVLRTWLFEHFLHPYPKDSDKHMMAKQTGLTRSQVSNWFINARVRMWKPMVEEMYSEEMKNQEQINSGDPENSAENGTNKESGSKLITAHPQQNNHTTMVPLQSKKHKQVIIKNQVTNPSTKETQIIPSSTTTVTTSSIQAGVEPNFVQHITSLNMEKGLTDQNNTKKPRQDNSRNCNYHLDHTSKDGVRVNNGEFSTRSSSIYHGIGFRTHGRFSASAEQLATTGFHGNNVCLTLALPRSESSQFSGHQQNLLSDPRNFTRILETGTVENGNRINGYQSSAASHANIAGHDQNVLDFQNRSKPFPAQLLPDFLASQI